MRKAAHIAGSVLVRLLALVTVLALAFVIYFIISEALPVFRDVGVGEFLFGTRWMPIAYTGEVSFGIFNFIAGTLYVSLLGMLIALAVGLGAALYLACIASERARGLLYPFIDLLAGIPSVIYGFVGLTVVVRLMIRLGVHTGSCVLAAAIVLAVMLLPYLVSTCSETLLRVKDQHLAAAEALGVSKWYAVTTMILPAAWRHIWTAMILAIGRAMGETMAVMMVMGNANLFPTLLGKGESIASLIALEMGTAVAGSTHYHALYAAGLVLMVLLFLINVGISLVHERLMR